MGFNKVTILSRLWQGEIVLQRRQKDGRKIEGWEVEDLQIRGIKIKEEVRKVEGGKVQ